MKRAKKLPKRVFPSSPEAELRRARMRTYLDTTRETFIRNLSEVSRPGLRGSGNNCPGRP